MKRFIFSALMTMLFFPAFGEEMSDTVATADTLPPHRKIVELGIDEKIIYVNELGLPPNTMIIDALSMFPELLGRNSDDFLNRYDVQLDDVSVGFNKVSVLSHTMISEVHHIEITTDPSVSQSTSGVGGVINIITMAVDSGLSGNVSLDLYTNFNLMPSVTLAYKRDKLTIYGSAMLSYYDYKVVENESKEYPLKDDWKYHENFYKGLSEAMKFGLTYQFNKRDKLTLWVIQNLDNYNDSASNTIHSVSFADKSKADSGAYVNGFSNINAPALHSQIDAIMKFERLYGRPGHKLYASMTYSNNHTEDENMYYYTGNYFTADGTESRLYNKYVKRPHNISTSLYYRFHLLPEEMEHILKLKAGMNYNMGFTKGTDYSYAGENTTFNDFTQDYTLTPYLTFNYQWEKLQMELSAKYRFKVRRGRGEDSNWQNNMYHDFLGNFNITYTPVKHHQLRASTSRSITTPSNIQIYEKMYYKQVDKKWYLGNPYLKEPVLMNVDLQYFYQYRNRRHEFQLNAAVEYVNAKNLIYQESIDALGSTIVTWNNSDMTSHIVDGRLSIFWQTGIFSATFGGNFYNNMQRPTGSDKVVNMFYYNLMLKPVLHFERGWTLSGQCIYNSHVYNGDLTQGDAIYMDVMVAKAWGPWCARLSFENTYDYVSTDVKKSGDATIVNYYNPYQCQIMIGFTYSFHKEPKRKAKEVM